ncbi:MAG: hypothetical protein Q7S22_05200 [Candidatus Micrarchaeota archaeon]|nr:hypothetical protein [Candidatus Micrarchaeota archaeon]
MLQTQHARIIRSPEEFSRSAASRISVTLRPKDKLYLGDAILLASAIKHLRETPEAKLRVDIADLDVDLQRGTYFLPYSRDPRSLVITERIITILNQLTESIPSLKNRIYVKIFSKWMEDEKFMDFFSVLLRDPVKSRKVKREITGGSHRSFELPFFPICDICDHTTTCFGKINRVDSDVFLVGECRNPECGSKLLVARNISKPGTYGVYYLLDNAGDVFNLPDFGITEVHFTGLKPDRTWGQKQKILADVNYNLLSFLVSSGVEVPAYYGIPRITEPSAKKITLDDFMLKQAVNEIGAIDAIIDILSKNPWTELPTMLFI